MGYSVTVLMSGCYCGDIIKLRVCPQGSVLTGLVAMLVASTVISVALVSSWVRIWKHATLRVSPFITAIFEILTIPMPYLRSPKNVRSDLKHSAPACFSTRHCNQTDYLEHTHAELRKSPNGVELPHNQCSTTFSTLYNENQQNHAPLSNAHWPFALFQPKVYTTSRKY